MQTTITVPFFFNGTHFWAKAPDKYKHLRTPHSHTFQCFLTVQVLGDDRELSFEELVDWLKDNIIPSYQGFTYPFSCEMLARDILARAEFRYKDRLIEVVVSEDGGPFAKITNQFKGETQ